MYATTMKTVENPSTNSLDTTPPTPSPLPRRPRGIRQFHILASVLLSRPPLLLPDIDPFDYQIQRYQEYIQRHQYTRFPLNFFFKKGSIGERQWKRQHPDLTKTSGSGLLRDAPDESGQRGPEWILGGNHDKQVMAARKNAGTATPRKEKTTKEETLTDQERRDLEQYAEQEAGLLNEVKTLPRWINRDQRRLERHPEQTVYCLVKRSIPFHEKSGSMGPRKYTLIAEEALGFDEGHQPEGLHMVASKAISRHLGKRVQTWVVGTNPAAYVTRTHHKILQIDRNRYRQTREFIMKAHIFAGATRVRRKYCIDAIWVTRKEMEGMLDEDTLKAVKPLLADR